MSIKVNSSQTSRRKCSDWMLVWSLIGAGMSQRLSHLPGVPYLQATGEPLVRFCGSDSCTISHAHFFQMIPALDRHSSETATDYSQTSSLVRCNSSFFKYKIRIHFMLSDFCNVRNSPMHTNFQLA